MNDQAESLRTLMNQDSTAEGGGADRRVIAVASGKGGVGKSNFCVNFALGLQRANHRPIVIDADVGFADIEVLLGIHPQRTMVDVVKGTSIWEALEYDSTGLPFLSAGNGLLNIHELLPHELDRLLQELDRLQDKHDIILVDSGAGMGDNMGRLLMAADDLVLVTTPEPTSIADGYALLKMMVVRGNVPNVQLVVNRARSFTDAKLTADKLRMVADRFLDLNIGVLGYVLEDVAVPNSVMRQEALLQAYPNSPAARCIEQIVKNYLRLEPEVPRTGITGFLQKLLHRRSGGEVNSSHTA